LVIQFAATSGTRFKRCYSSVLHHPVEYNLSDLSQSAVAIETDIATMKVVSFLSVDAFPCLLIRHQIAVPKPAGTQHGHGYHHGGGPPRGNKGLHYAADHGADQGSRQVAGFLLRRPGIQARVLR